MTSLIIGAGNTCQRGWHSLKQEDLDIRYAHQWAQVVRTNSVDNILAEHVFEHMTFEDGFKAASNCYRALKPFGRLRIAVPDGFHPDPAYINWVKPGGIWNPHDHLVLYNYKTLSKLLMRAGFRVLLLEWHDERGQLHVRQWSDANGMVWRSVKHWYAGFLTLVVGARYTSLIVDAVKVEGK